MAENDKTKTLVCEQCGAPLPELGEDVGCINCLLRSGFEELAAQSPDDAPSRLFQHYEILLRPDDSLWELGRGSIGITYKAQDVALGTTVALKVLNPLFPIAPERRRIFLRQLQVAAHLHHPNVAGIFHLGIINPAASDETSTAGATAAAGGECFYTMEFVEGESLEARVRRTGPLAPTLALQVGLQAAQALNAAENIGLVQRTIAPADLFLTTEPDPGGPLETNMPSVKVIDFGLSKLCRENQAAEPRADVRSLGEILWFSLTGTRLELPPGEKPSTSPLRWRGVPPSVIALLDSIFSPRGETAGIAQITERLQRCLTSARTQRFSASRYACAAGAAAVLIALVFFVIPAPASREKSIAVLPFRNLSQDPADAFFAEGVQDDILSRLVKVHDLKVISRLGAQHYPAEQARDFRAIGHQLGVRHLLEGSLRRSGQQVYVTVALIDTRDGRRVWSENYTRKPADATQIEGTLAADIADALGSKLSEPERQVLVANSTHNPDAYALYLQGRKLEKNVTIAISAYEAAQALYQQAVTLDPRFALAHAHLSITLGMLYQFRGPSDELKDRAQTEARVALQLSAGLGEAHLALGLYYYRVERDYSLALPQLQRAHELLPNDAQTIATIAYIHRRQGLWREARGELQQAVSREPLDQEYEEELYATAVLLHDWPAAAAHAARAAMIAPQMYPLNGENALVPFWQNGDLGPLTAFCRKLSGFGDTTGNFAWLQWDIAMLTRDFGVARSAVDTFPYETLPAVLGAPVPKSYLQGCTALAEGERARARNFFETARPAMEAEAIAHPKDALRHARLGLLYAYMGREEDALREGELAVRLTPVSKDAIDGHQWLATLALIHARVGDNDRAIAMLDDLLREPGCVSALNEASLSLSDLRFRWQWDPLRSDPRFQRILAAPEPATIY